MSNEPLEFLKDERMDCYSILIPYSYRKYLDLVESAYENKGGLDKQRTVLKTSTAKRIRERMVKDLEAGAILPPVVLGMVLPKKEFNRLPQSNLPDFKKLIHESSDSLTIIDGMQRTTAIKEVVRALSSDSEQPRVRVEYWLAQSTNSLIYRMLVLNTGQVPWNLRRQIEVVFSSIITELKNSSIPLEVSEIDDSRRRKKGGQYQADKLIELFLAFGLRKEKVIIQEQLADEFSRLDFIQATSHPDFIEDFKTILGYFVALDIAFDKYSPKEIKSEERFKKGKEIFDNQPASVGFIVACAREIMGKPGSPERSSAEKTQRLKQLSTKIDSLLKYLEKLNESKLGEFLDLDTLNEVIHRKKVGRFGDYERAFFLKAFETLIEEKEVSSLTVCWRAY